MENNPRTGTYIALSQICLIFFLGISIALHPGFVFKSNEGGVSNYGIHLKTGVPFTLAFGLCAFFCLKAARLCPRSKTSTGHLRYLLYTYSCLMLLTLASTYFYKVNYAFKQAHVAVGAATIIFQLLASLWMFFHLKSFLDLMFLILQLLGFVFAGLTFLGALHVLFLGQALAAFGFALLLVRTGLNTPQRDQSATT